MLIAAMVTHAALWVVLMMWAAVRPPETRRGLALLLAPGVAAMGITLGLVIAA